MNSQDALSAALEQLTYGLYLVIIPGITPEDHAMVATWVTQVSFEPPLIAISVEEDSVARRLLRTNSPFVLLVLSASATEMAKYVLKHARLPPGHSPSGRAKSGAQVDPPLSSLALLKCSVKTQMVSGDHVVFIAEVEDATLEGGNDRPLTLHDTGWKYRNRK